VRIDQTTNTDIVNDWLNSGQSARLCGLDLKPIPHSVFPDRPLCIVKGQAAVYFLREKQRGNVWLLKLFNPGRRPADDYLNAVGQYLPGPAAFFTCTQRRILTKDHLDLRNSGYRNTDFARLIEGAVMMPKVPGTTWASIADDLRDGTQHLPPARRLQMSLNLARSVSTLEAGHCSHRDLSATNVFFAQNDRAYLIDWDCLYHPQLLFQPNTTVGTMGYIASFLKVTEGHADGKKSWCQCADRFALAVLIAEILLVGPETACPNEDGSLFSQAQIDTPGHQFVQDQIQQLRQFSKPCASLAEQAFNSTSFAECPSPGDWVGALKYTLRNLQTVKTNETHEGRYRRFVHVACSQCGVSFRLSELKAQMIEDKGQALLCRGCLKKQLDEWSAEKARRNLDVPQVRCEHCKEYFRLPREKLAVLLARGRPILCAPCLTAQMRMWRSEREKQYPGIACSRCGFRFNIRLDKLTDLNRRGKPVLCRDCLRNKLRASGDSKAAGEAQKDGLGSSLWKLIRRTFHVHFS
jgi:Protein tyrosine and serine/threonine kinase